MDRTRRGQRRLELGAFGAIGLFAGPVTITLLRVLWREWTEAEPCGVDAP